MTTHPHDPVDTTPEPDDIVGAEVGHQVNIPPLPVKVDGPVRVVSPPTRSAGWRSYDLSTTVAVKILGRDPRRRRAVIIAHNSVTGTAKLGETAAQALSDQAFILPVGLGSLTDYCTIEYTSTDEVWASGSVDLSVLNEQWSD